MNNPRLIARMMLLDDSEWFDDLWLWYWANGGNAGKFEFDAYLRELSDRDPSDQMILACAIEDLSWRVG